MKEYIHLLIISMVPLIELRGAMIYAALCGLPFIPSLICCVVGNILPVPFLIKFSKKILLWLAGIKYIGPIFQRIIDHGNKKASKISGIELLGLFLFVAIPIPGTGAWTASLVSALLQLRIIKSSLAIFLGVICCGIIMGFISFGLTSMFL